MEKKRDAKVKSRLLNYEKEREREREREGGGGGAFNHVDIRSELIERHNEIPVIPTVVLVLVLVTQFSFISGFPLKPANHDNGMVYL